MITIEVKTLFNGDIGIRDRYIMEAKRTGESITVIRDDGVMLIPNSEIDQRCTGQSDRKFADKYGREGHYLYYFNWKPDSSQAVMI